MLEVSQGCTQIDRQMDRHTPPQLCTINVIRATSVVHACAGMYPVTLGGTSLAEMAVVVNGVEAHIQQK